MNWKEYIIKFIKNPADTIEFIDEQYSMKKVAVLILLGCLLLFPNFIIFQFRGEIWIYLLFVLALIGLFAVLYVNYQIIFYLLSKLMYRHSDYPFEKIRKINIWNIAIAFFLCQLFLMPLQLVFLYIREYGVGFYLYWLVIMIWYIWVLALEFQIVNFHIKENSLKNMYFVLISQFCGFGIFQILTYIGFLSMY